MENIFVCLGFLLILFASNTLQTITGFAGTLLAMPAAILLVGTDNAKTVLNIFTILACAGIAWQNRQFINKKILLKIIVFMFIGMISGIFLYDYVPENILLRCYGLLLMGVGLKNLVANKKLHLNKIFQIIVLLAAGIIHGMFVSGGSLLVIYAASVLEDKNEFRATISPVWVILNTLMIYSHYESGFYTKEILIFLCISIIPLLLSIKAGNILYKRINQATFLKLSYILLVISGLLLIF